MSPASPAQGRLARAHALIAGSPLDRAVAAMAAALLLAWLLALITPIGFAPTAVAEWIMARTPADLANTLLDRLGPLARPTALLGGYACYLLLAIAAGTLHLAAGWLRHVNLTPGPSPAELERGAYIQHAAISPRSRTLPPTLRQGTHRGDGAGQRGQRLSRTLAPTLRQGTPLQLRWRGAGGEVPVLLLLLAPLWAILTRLLSLPFWPNALLLTLFTSAWLLLTPTRTPLTAEGGTSRRTFLRTAGLTAATVMISANVVFAGALFRATRGARLGGQFLFGWTPPPARLPGFDLHGHTAEVTSVPAFYHMSKNVADPAIDAGDWSLRIHGLVDRPITLSHSDLLAAPRHDTYVTLRCISNRIDGRLMSTALFSGVPLRSLLEQTGLNPAAQTAVFRSPDGHADSLDLARALADTTLVAYAINGRTLTRDHGFPARLLAPGVYGFKHVKWLTEIELIAGEFAGAWQDLGWTRTARVKTMARIDTARRKHDRLVAAGVAFAGDRGISAVQVQAGDGPWIDAALHTPPLSALTWVQWRADLPPDTRRLTVRAIDGAGVPQDTQPRGQFPDGAQGLHHVDLPA